MSIIPRAISFTLEKDYPRYWYNQSPVQTYHMNVLAVYLPYGEKFFIHCVKNFAHCIKDPILKQSINAFLKQEAYHGREHTRLFKHTIALHYPNLDVSKYKFWLTGTLAFLAGKKFRLAMAAAGEHYTAVVASTYLKYPEGFEKMPSDIAIIWKWHAIEELEHKEVVFNMLKPLKIGYLTRITAFLLMTVIQVSSYIRPFFHMAKHDKLLFSFGFYKSIMLHFKSIRLESIKAYWAYLKPSFHPSHQDTYPLIQNWIIELNNANTTSEKLNRLQERH
tara:strand:+ start:53610 stop:54440 length:831 start_codon:yes stop_codon:yes gene_type:complete